MRFRHSFADFRRLYDFPNGDKLGHFVLFGLLNFFLTFAFLSRFQQNPKRFALSAGFILAAVITAEEFSQRYFSTRTFDLGDLTASLLGVFIGGWIAWRLKK